jgi:VanZ family protein
VTTFRAVVVWRVLLAAVAVAIAWGSLLPSEDLPGNLLLSDTLLHLLGYLVLGALAVLSRFSWPWALGIVITFGLALEVAQGMGGSRMFQWSDLAADALGALAGVLLTARIVREVDARRADRDRQQKRQTRRERRDRQRNPAPKRAMNPVKAAARRGAPTWQQVAQRQGGKCWLCGTRTYEQDRARDAAGREALGATFPCVDFVVAVESGGTYEDANVRLAHRHCAAARRANPSLTQFGRPRRTYS